MDKAVKARILIEDYSLCESIYDYHEKIWARQNQAISAVRISKEKGLGENLIAQSEIMNLHTELSKLRDYLNRCINAIEETQETVGAGPQTTQGTTEEQQEGKGS